jgi:hypothetical protein
LNDVDFRQALSDAGIPTTQAQLQSAWEAEVIDQGSRLSNTSAWSPFWRVVTALVTKPVLWFIDYMVGYTLPNAYVKTAVGDYLRMLAWAVMIEPKSETKAAGQLLFTRLVPVGTLEVAAGTRVQSGAINGRTYELITTAPGTFADTQSQILIPVIAALPGSGYNLAPGYYGILPEPVPGVVSVVNLADWLTVPGSDNESDQDIRLRTRNQYSAINQWNTDAVYRALITTFPGVRPDGVYFEHDAPRGPGTANAFVLFEANVPAHSYLQEINDYIGEQGNHGHGDDMLVMVMPETLHDVRLTVWPVLNLTQPQLDELYANIALFIRAAFRESTQTDYQPTLTYPQSRFSFSRLTEELHQQFSRIESMDFDNVDIESQLNIPRLLTLQVVPGV